MILVIQIIGFLIVVLASHQIGRFSAGLKLPLITGYLLTGTFIGPFFLGWFNQNALQTFRIIDETALAFIAFAAGSELYLKELRSQMKSIVWITTWQTLFTMLLGTSAILIFSDAIPFMQSMSRNTKIAVALMASAILIARSPSSVIAIVNELRARGPFTKKTLGVTMLIDVVVILVFAIFSMISQFLVSGGELKLEILLQVFSILMLSTIVGYLISKCLAAISGVEIPLFFRALFILAIGLAIFMGSNLLNKSNLDLPMPIKIEPLLTCMIASALMVNKSQHRDEFIDILHHSSPSIYVAFFTLVGASLALNTMLKFWIFALFLFIVRLLGIALGTLIGGIAAKDKRQYISWGWMAYITQAGVGLGLAKDVADEFQTFGTDFAALIIAVIIINQIIGPPLLKSVIKIVGEARLPGTAEPDKIRDAVILGIDYQSLAVARQLASHKWSVVLADTDKSHVDRLNQTEFRGSHIQALEDQALSQLLHKSTDAVVAMLGNDEANFKACEFAYEKIGIKRLVVQIHDLSWSDDFSKLGAWVVEPSSAMVNVLDQFVRAPHSAALFMHRDPQHEIIQITVIDEDIIGLPLRDLLLPTDVRVLEIIRDGHSLVPHGHTILRHGDDVTLVGEKVHLDEVASRWGY